MKDHIRNLMQSRAFELDYPCLFDSSNIKCLYGILDAAGRGYITSEQFKSGVHYITKSLSLLLTTIQLLQVTSQHIIDFTDSLFTQWPRFRVDIYSHFAYNRIENINY